MSRQQFEIIGNWPGNFGVRFVRILITGANGQLGLELQSALADHELLALGRERLDITLWDVVSDVMMHFRPDIVIHTAAETNVDGCELNPDLAYQVNALGTQNVAVAAANVGAAVVYISTDYVFDGKKGEPYLEFDDPSPINTYGRSKLAGERYIQQILRRFYIVRTSWLYGSDRNFVKTILSLADTRTEIWGVIDEIGSPTYARDLAYAIAKLIEHPAYGIYHFANDGSCSRYEFIKAICEEANRNVSVVPVTSSEFLSRNPLPARRPSMSVLRNFCGAVSLGIRLRPWREALRDFIDDHTLRRL